MYQDVAELFAELNTDGIGADVRFAKCDGSEHDFLAATFGVEGFPTIVLLRTRESADETTVTVYGGKKDLPSLASTLAAFASDDHVTWLEDEGGLEEWVRENGGMVYVSNTHGRVPRMFYELADRVAAKIEVAYISNATSVGMEEDIVSVYAPGSATGGLPVSDAGTHFSVNPVPALEEVPVMDMVAQIYSAWLPDVVFINEDTYQMLYDEELALHDHIVILALSHVLSTEKESEERASVLASFADLAAQFGEAQERWQFAVLEAKESTAGLLAEYGLEYTESRSNAPDAVVVVMEPFAEPKGKYRLDADYVEDPGSAVSFLDQLAAGELERYIKSEPAPSRSTVDGLTSVVGSTFAKHVMTEKRDVLLVLTLAGCKACKAFKPLLEEIAASAKKIKTLTVATMDAKKNDFPFDLFPVKKYPAVYVVPAKGAPVPFTGIRNVATVLDFVSEHATLASTRKKTDAILNELSTRTDL